MTSTLPPVLSDYLDMQPEVSGALKTGAPVVALESTIVTHGMPFPQNMEMAARRRGADPRRRRGASHHRGHGRAAEDRARCG